jgi:hypothetical protein
MHDLYRIGIAAGAGVAIGLVATGMLARAPRATLLAAVVAGAAAGALAYAVFGWRAGVAAAIAGLLAGASAGTFLRGALRRGGTAGGTALLFVLAGAVALALALIPVVGYLEAVALPVFAARARKRAGEKYAGLRTLAK